MNSLLLSSANGSEISFPPKYTGDRGGRRFLSAPTIGWSQHLLQHSVIYINDLLFNSKLQFRITFNQPVSMTELNINRRARKAAPSRNFDIITDWRAKKLVSINASKTQSWCLSTKKHDNQFPILINGQKLNL